MEGNQVGNRLVPSVSLGANFDNANGANGAGATLNDSALGNISANFGANRSAEVASGRLAVEKARKKQLQKAQQIQTLLGNRNKVPRATAAALTWDTTPAEAPSTVENPNPIPDEGLVWPHHLIEEIARARKPKNLQLRLTRFFFLIGSLGALAVSLVSLILIAVFQDFEWVRTVYTPTASKIVLGVFVLLDLIVIPQLLKTLQNLRETTNNPFTNIQPFSAKVRHRTLIYAFGLLVLNFIIWLSVVAFELSPQILTGVLGAVILLTPFFSLCVQKNVLPSRLGYMPLQIFYIIGMVLSGLTIILNFFAFYEEPPEPIDYAAIERLAKAQQDARQSDVPAGLSDLVFAICENQPYSVVFMSTTNPNSGLFECNESHEVYSVTGPTETTDESASTGKPATSNPRIMGSAFYFGTTSDPLINRYFPAFTGAKYLFRDFRPVDGPNKSPAREQIPSELVLLLPGTSDEELVTTNLGSIANLLREHGETELRFSLFYTDATDTIQTTRDFILIAATGTITLNDWLPHGSTYESIIDGEPGKYEFTIDHDLPALIDLGADPALYSSQTRDAIKSRRHISTVLSGIPTSDALRAQLLEGFVEPNV